MWISWKHEDSEFAGDLTHEQKVELFVEQVLGWHLHIADVISNGGVAYGERGSTGGANVSAVRHAGFAVLQICLSYFEVVGAIVDPKASNSRRRFHAGLKHVLGESVVTSEFFEAFYGKIRNGLLHVGRIAPRTGLTIITTDPPVVFEPQSKTLAIDPHKLPKFLKAHLVELQQTLMSSKDAPMGQHFGLLFDTNFAAHPTRPSSLDLPSPRVSSLRRSTPRP